MRPQVHADIIKRWADGAEIQYWNKYRECWTEASTPSWNENLKYRVKPQPKPDYAKFGEFKYIPITHQGFIDPPLIVFADGENNYVDSLYNTRTSKTNLKFIFDGETNKLKAVEVLDNNK